MSDVRVRSATLADAQAIALLATELGYPATADVLRPRLERLIGSPSDRVLVGFSGETGIVGWIHVFLSQRLESDFRAEIGGLVVASAHQGQGAGRALVLAAAHWAAEHNAAGLVVRCQTHRSGAHDFYRRLGFVPTKTQQVFLRPLADMASA